MMMSNKVATVKRAHYRLGSEVQENVDKGHSGRTATSYANVTKNTIYTFPVVVAKPFHMQIRQIDARQ